LEAMAQLLGMVEGFGGFGGIRGGWVWGWHVLRNWAGSHLKGVGGNEVRGGYREEVVVFVYLLHVSSTVN
jgi:hypothetical protein